MIESTAVRETMLEFFDRIEARTAGDALPAGAADRSGAGP